MKSQGSNDPWINQETIQPRRGWPIAVWTPVHQ